MVRSREKTPAAKVMMIVVALGLLSGMAGCVEMFGLDKSIPISAPTARRTFTIDAGEFLTRNPIYEQWADLFDGVVEEPVEIGVNYTTGFDIELTELEPRLKNYRGKVDRIEITAISYQVKENSFTQDLGPLSFYFGELEERDADSESVAKYGSTERIYAQTVDTEGPRVVEVADPPDGVEAVGEYLSEFDFSALLNVSKIYVDPTVPVEGELKIELAIDVTFFVKPLN